MFYIVESYSKDMECVVYEVCSSRADAKSLAEHLCYEDADACDVCIRNANADEVEFVNGVLYPTQAWVEKLEV